MKKIIYSIFTSILVLDLLIIVCTVIYSFKIVDTNTIGGRTSELWNVRGSDILEPSDTDYNLRIPSLASCDTMDTDVDGNFSCGVDDGGSFAGTLNDISDVSTSSPTNYGNLLMWNGTAWTNTATSALGIVGTGSGTVTSASLIASSSFSVYGSPITTSGTFGIGLASGYNIPLTASTSNWQTAYSWGNHAGLYDFYGQATSTKDWLLANANTWSAKQTFGNTTIGETLNVTGLTTLGNASGTAATFQNIYGNLTGDVTGTASGNLTGASMINTWFCNGTDSATQITCATQGDSTADCDAGDVCMGGHTHSSYLSLAAAYATTTMSQLTTLANVTDIGTIAKLDFTLASGTQATIGTNFYIDSVGKVTQTYASGTAATFANFYGALTGTASGNLTSSSIDTIAELNAIMGGEDVASTTWAGASSLVTLGTVTTGTWNASTITVNKGGTGLTSLSAGYIPFGSNTTNMTSSSALQFSGSTLTVTYASSTGITATNFYGNWAGDTIGVTKGGTGLTAIAAGGLLYASSSNYMAVLASSTANSVLTINSSGFPAWSIPYVYPAFSIASTTWNGIAGLTASSTIVLKPLYTNETWSGFRCYTDTGTALIKIGTSSAYSTAVTASSTANEIGYAKSYLAGEIMQAVISNISATTNWVACTIKKVNY